MSYQIHALPDSIASGELLDCIRYFPLDDDRTGSGSERFQPIQNLIICLFLLPAVTNFRAVATYDTSYFILYLLQD